jgi:hypothetical protein
VIRKRAWVLVIARFLVRRVFTPSSVSTNVVRTRVAVVAFDGVAEARPIDTVVGHRTGISVFAGTGRQDVVDAAVLPGTLVRGAVVVVVAQVDVVPAHKHGFVDVIVTVVINAVTGFLGWL